MRQSPRLTAHRSSSLLSMRLRGALALYLGLVTAIVSGCTSTGVRRQVKGTRVIEFFSIQAVHVRYPSGLDPDQMALVQRYQPGELVASRVEEWSRELGMWGSPDELTIIVDRLRLPVRWKTSQHGPIVIGTAAGYRGEDHLGMRVEVRRNEELVYEIDVLRSVAALDRRFPELFSSDYSMGAMIDELAWRILYELTPPGYDEEVILLGHERNVGSATMKAARRGLLSYGTMLKESAEGTFRWNLKDNVCGSALSKPGWLPWFFWAPITYKPCEARAEMDARRELADE